MLIATRIIYTLTWVTLITAKLRLNTRSIRLNDGNKIPSLGLGTFGKVSEIGNIGPAVVTAIEAGYRLIDTAFFYQNEGVVGEAISNVTSRGIVKRKELFITSKLSILIGRDAVVPALKLSLAKLKLDYIDLYLIHVPRNQTTGEDYDYLDIWKGMEDAQMLGLTKSIGVSNFNSSNVNRILSNCKTRPAVNQIEVNPSMANMGLVAYCQSQNIQVMAYAPFGFAVPRPFNNKTLPPSFDDPTLVEIADEYDKCTSQVFLRYLTLTAANFHSRTIRLNDGNRIPPIAFGTLGKVSEIESVGSAVVTAVEAGFRHINTGHYFMNEEIIGDAILNVTSRGIVKRKQLFISTSLRLSTGREDVVPALRRSLARFKLDYIDLFLIHTPINQTTGEEYPYLDIWKGMEDAKMLGLAKSIGCLNYNSSQINKIISESKIRPAVHAIEVNPTMANMDLVAYCQSQNIQVMSYAPFGFAVPRPFNNKTLPPSFDDPTIEEIADEYDKSTSQVFLRYLIDRAIIPIPKSTNVEHIRSNIDVFDFRLTREQVYKISEFDKNTAVYLQNGFYSAEFFSYIFGKSLEEVIKDERMS